MPLTGIIVDPDQLAMLTRVLEGHCQARGINHRAERESVARYILSEFQSGAETADELMVALVGCSEREKRQERRAAASVCASANGLHA
jgi:hypothetical protein